LVSALISSLSDITFETVAFDTPADWAILKILTALTPHSINLSYYSAFEIVHLAASFCSIIVNGGKQVKEAVPPKLLTRNRWLRVALFDNSVIKKSVRYMPNFKHLIVSQFIFIVKFYETVSLFCETVSLKQILTAVSGWCKIKVYFARV